MSKKILAAIAAVGFAATAMAAVTVDADGKGFVGKGDVQLKFDWNNAALQSCVNTAATFENVLSGCLAFRLSSSSATVSTWTCSRTTPSGQEVETKRHNSTTTTLQGLASSTARVKQQVTGFNLLGIIGDPNPVTETSGQPLESCPSDNGAQQFTYDGNLVTTTTTSGAGLEVRDTRVNPADWKPLPNTP